MASTASSIVFRRSPKLAPRPITTRGPTSAWMEEDTRDVIALPIYAARMMTYVMAMPGLSMSELAIVAFILMLVTLAGRLPRWGEALGSYLYKRANPTQAENVAERPHDGDAPRTSATSTGSSNRPPT